MQISNAYQNPYAPQGQNRAPRFSYPPFYSQQAFINRYRRPGNRRQGGCCLVNLLVLLVVVLILGLCVHFFVSPLYPLGPTSVTVGAHPTLVLDSSTYTPSYRDAPIFRIHSGNAQDRIILTPANPWILPLLYDQTSDKSKVVLNARNFPASDVSIDITVPTLTDLKISTNSADIEVNGVTGQFVLISNGGTITITHSTVHGPSLFENNTGSIVATQNTLDGQVTLDNNTGPTTFDNATAPNGSYQLRSNTGTIDCTVRANASLHIDATVNNKGSISSDIAGMQVQNKELHGDLGKTPRASVLLYDNQGAITLHTRKGD